MRNSLYKFVILLVFFVGTRAYAQQIAACQNAQNACDNPGFQLTPGGTGLPSGLNVSNPSTNPAGAGWSGCLLSNGPGPNWMILTVGSSGMLGFSFGANGSAFPQVGLYDWALWSYDPNTCANIFNNTLPPVACNWNGSSIGGTGMGPIPPGGSSSNYVPSIPATAGQQFILLLSNYSGVSTSVTIQNNGTAGLTCSPLLMPSAIRCPNQPAVLTATWMPGLTNALYTLASSLPLNAATSTTQTSPTFNIITPVTKTYTLFASATNSIGATVTASTAVTVSISPTVTMNIVASPNPTTALGLTGNVCYNTPATFTALSAGTGYTLTGPNNLTSMSSIPIISTPSLTTGGSYTIGTTLFSGCTATGAINVNVAPNHSISVITNTNICMNAAVTLTASMPTATAYSWSGPNSYNGTGAVVTVTNVLPLGAGGYTASAHIIFNNITCLRTSVTQVAVVQTYPVSITTSPSNTLCQHHNLSLSASSSGTPSYHWSGPNNMNVYSQSAAVNNILPANAGIYTVNALFTNGFVTCPRTNTAQIWVVPTAQPTLSVPFNVCQNTDAVLSVSAAANPIGYSWTGPGTFTSNLQQFGIDSIQLINAGQYFAWAHFSIGGAKTCSVMGSAQLNVVPVNSISVIPPIPVCRPDNVYLFSSALAASGYTWTGPNNFVDYQNNTTIYNPPVSATGVYTIRVAFGGGALTCYNTTTAQVVVNPILTFQLPQRSLPYCYNDSIRINGPEGATSYTWTSSSGYTSNNKNLYLASAQPENSGVYTLSVSLGSCTTSDKTNIQILNRIKLDEAVLPKNMTLCKDAPPVYFQANALGGSQNYAFTWVPNSYLSSPTGSLIKANPKTTVEYNVMGYDIACPHYTLMHTFTVNVKSAPEPKLSLDKSADCAPLCLLYNPKIDKKENAIVFYEFINEANGASRKFQTDSSSNYSIDYCIQNPGSYKVKITTTVYTEESLVCSEVFEQPYPIVVYPNPGSDIIWTPQNPTISDNEVTFEAVSQYPSEILSWDFDGVADDTTLVISPQKVYENPGRYAVMLVIKTTEWGCYDTIIKFIDIKEDFNVFIPNTFTPNGDGLNDLFQVKGSAIQTKGFTMEIFDRWGNSVFFTQNPLEGWDGTNKNGETSEIGFYTYKIGVVSSNKEGRKEYIGKVMLLK